MRLTLALLLTLLPAQTFAACFEATLTGKSEPHTLVVEIAETVAEREKGLMFRETLSDDQGMLFLFPEEGPWPFWMLNTYVDLDIVPLREDGFIQEVLIGKKESTDLVWPTLPTKRILEVPAGLIDKVQATHFFLGDQITCPEINTKSENPTLPPLNIP